MSTHPSVMMSYLAMFSKLRACAEGVRMSKADALKAGIMCKRRACEARVHARGEPVVKICETHCCLTCIYIQYIYLSSRTLCYFSFQPEKFATF